MSCSVWLMPGALQDEYKEWTRVNLATDPSVVDKLRFECVDCPSNKKDIDTASMDVEGQVPQGSFDPLAVAQNSSLYFYLEGAGYGAKILAETPYHTLTRMNKRF